MRRIALCLLLVLAACGTEGVETPERWSGDPDADLALAFAAEDALAILRIWPVDREAYRKAPATQVALTERLRGRLSQTDPFDPSAVFSAFDDAELLRVRFGAGRLRDGRELDMGAIRAGVLNAAVDTAHALVSGDRPDREKALAALQIALRLRTDKDVDLIAQTVRWVGSQQLVALAAPEDWSLAPHDGPRVLAFMDHFTLGEEPVRAVLQRWAGTENLRVSLIPLWRKNVRMGMRRDPASRKQERAALQAVAQELGLHYETDASKQDWGETLGLGRTETAVLVLTSDGTIAGKLRGTFPNLQVVEGTVQRVTTR